MRIRINVAPALCALLTVALFGAPVKGEVYKWVDADGRIIYSDEPPGDGASALELPAIQTYSPNGGSSSTGVSGASRPAQQDGRGSRGYDSFSIVDPADDVTIWDNGGRLSIDLSLTPALRGQHTIEVLLDGAVLGEGRSTRITLVNIDRGTHVATAVIKDASGEEIARTDPVTFHLRRQSVITRERAEDFGRGDTPPPPPDGDSTTQ